MHYIIHHGTLQRLLFVCVLLALSFFFQDILPVFLPFVVLGCGGGDGSGDGGGDGGGDVGGSGGSCTGGGASCGETGSACSCGDCTGGCCGAAVSTPFLYVWRNGAFHLENDVMFGKMQNFFPTSEVGHSTYEAGGIPGDLYRIQSPMEIEDGKLRFQIREIEPEESFIDSLSFLRVSYPASAELFVDSSLQRYRAFKVKDIRNHKDASHISIKNIGNNVDLTNTLLTTEDTSTHLASSHEMNTNDRIEITAEVAPKDDKQFFLFLESYYRDWTAGEVMMFAPKASVKSFLQQQALSIQGASLAHSLRIVSTTFLFLIVWSLSFFWFNSNTTEHNNRRAHSEAGVLSAAWAAKTAHADAGGGRSLIVEYWDGSEYKHVETVHPRYYRPTFDAIALPSEVINADSTVKLRVTATKRHKVTQISIAAAQEFETTEEQIPVTKAYHNRMKRDFANVLNTPASKEYVRTIPADIVDIEAVVSESDSNESLQSSYMLQMSGFYNPASEGVQREAAGEGGDWTSKLEPDAREWLRDMQSLGTYV